MANGNDFSLGDILMASGGVPISPYVAGAAGEQVAEKLRRARDVALTPGTVLKGATTAAPGVMSDEDMARMLLNEQASNRNIFDLASTMAGSGGAPAAAEVGPSHVLGVTRQGFLDAEDRLHDLLLDSRFGFGSGSRRAAPIVAATTLRGPEAGLAAEESQLAAPAITRVGGPARPGPQTVTNPVGMPYPGIYKDPRELAAEAAARVGPEDPALQQLFGVSRGDLAAIGAGRVGNVPPQIATVANPKGSATAAAVMNPQNAQRLVDALSEAQRYPELMQPMGAWYVMDPAYQRLEQLVGPAEAARRYTQFNTLGSMASPASDVLTEINRGTAANMMATAGRFPEFVKYGGMAAAKRGPDFPAELGDVIGHPYHSTSQAGPMARYLETGQVEMSQPKVPLYIQASGVPQTGFQTALPVPDAHFTRAIGMADVRRAANPGVSMKTPEYAQTGPWFASEVARPMGVEAVPAQAQTWGVFAPQTGVETEIGAPKLELLAGSIARRAARLGIDPAALRDAVLMGGGHASLAAGLLGAGATMMPDQAQAGDVVPGSPDWGAGPRPTPADLLRAQRYYDFWGPRNPPTQVIPLPIQSGGR